MRQARHLAAVPALALLAALISAGGAAAQAAPPNLTTTSFAGPACAEIGGVIGGQITITMTNTGPANLPAAPAGTDCSGETENTCVWIGFYISSDATITTGDTLLTGGRENLQAELGDNVPFNVDDTIIDFLFSGASVTGGSPTGNVYLGVVVDEEDDVTEASETDNTAWQPIQIGGCGQQLPDLVVDSLTHEPANPNTADLIDFTATVKNVGGAMAGPSTLCFEIGGESCSLQPDSTLFDVPTLAVGEVFAVSRSATLEVAQDYLNTAVADYNQEVTESDEQNNTTTDSFTVTEATAPVALVYQVVSLPAHGTLQGLDACSLQQPCNLPSVKVTYEPDVGFVGTDSFAFQVFDARTGLTSVQAASIGIFVADLLDLFDTPLTVDFQGSGRGDVAMDIGGSVVAICDDDCTKDFNDGQLVKLQARPIDEYTFVGWGGACIVSQQNSQIASLILPSQGATCTATFGP